MRRRWSDRSSRRVRTLVTQLARSRLVRESARMRADIHDGPEQTLQSEAGYSNARPHQPGRRNLLHRTAGPYSRVKTGKARTEHKISALPKTGHRAFSQFTGGGYGDQMDRPCVNLILTGGAGAIEWVELDVETLQPGAVIDGPLRVPSAIGDHIEPAGC